MSSYSDWQLDQLRRGLTAFKGVKARSGVKPSWQDIATAIALTPGANNLPPDDGSALLKSVQEGLRRFAAGQQTPGSEQLDDIRNFLVAQRILNADRLSDTQQISDEAAAIWTYLGELSPESQRVMERLSDEYVGIRETPAGCEEILIRIVARPLRSLYLVEEQYQHTLPATAHSRPVVCSKTIRRGYAFTVTANHYISMTFRAEYGRELVQYVETRRGGQIGDVNTLLVLHRIAATEVRYNCNGDSAADWQLFTLRSKDDIDENSPRSTARGKQGVQSGTRQFSRS